MYKIARKFTNNEKNISIRENNNLDLDLKSIVLNKLAEHDEGIS